MAKPYHTSDRVSLDLDALHAAYVGLEFLARIAESNHHAHVAEATPQHVLGVLAVLNAAFRQHIEDTERGLLFSDWLRRGG